MSIESLSPARLEAFSDGVIAVIITIMVLELKVPAADGLAGVIAILPTLLLYLLSFVQIGIYWVNHHYLVDEADSVTHATLWANLVFLFCLSLFPLATAWVGEKHLSPFSTALYAAVSLFPGLSYGLLWLAVRKRSSVPPHASWTKIVTSTVLYSLAVPAAFLRPGVAVAMMCGVAVLWLLPPRPHHPAAGDSESAPAPPFHSSAPRAATFLRRKR